MKKLLLGGVCLLFAMTLLARPALSASQERDSNKGIRSHFVGAWRLAWLEEEGADGKVQRVDVTGMLVYTPDGHMSVQVMYLAPQAGPNAGRVQYAQNGYEASFGRYDVPRTIGPRPLKKVGISLVGKRGFELGENIPCHLMIADEYGKVEHRECRARAAQLPQWAASSTR